MSAKTARMRAQLLNDKAEAEAKIRAVQEGLAELAVQERFMPKKRKPGVWGPPRVKELRALLREDKFSTQEIATKMGLNAASVGAAGARYASGLWRTHVHRVRMAMITPKKEEKQGPQPEASSASIDQSTLKALNLLLGRLHSTLEELSMKSSVEASGVLALQATLKGAIQGELAALSESVHARLDLFERHLRGQRDAIVTLQGKVVHGRQVAAIIRRELGHPDSVSPTDGEDEAEGRKPPANGA